MLQKEKHGTRLRRLRIVARFLSVDGRRTIASEKAGPQTKLTASDHVEIPSFSVTGPDDERPDIAQSMQQTSLRDNTCRGRRKLPSRDVRNRVERGLCCANCYESFGHGRVITANNRRYHPIHFACYECGVPLEHVDFYTHDPEAGESDQTTQFAEIYCHFDYHEHFSPRCYV